MGRLSIDTSLHLTEKHGEKQTGKPQSTLTMMKEIGKTDIRDKKNDVQVDFKSSQTKNTKWKNSVIYLQKN